MNKVFEKIIEKLENAISAVDFAMEILIGTKILMIGYISRRESEKQCQK